MEIIYKDIVAPRLTIDGERTTLKIPLGYKWNVPLIAFAKARAERIQENPFRARIRRKGNSFELGRNK